MGIPATELTQIRADMESWLMPETGIIQRVTYTANAIGARVETWRAIGTVPCHLWKTRVSPFYEETGNQMQTTASAWVTVPWDTAMEADDRIVIDSINYTIVKAWHSVGWQLVIEAELKKLD